MGGTTAPVVGSNSCPAWMARVANPLWGCAESAWCSAVIAVSRSLVVRQKCARWKCLPDARGRRWGASSAEERQQVGARDHRDRLALVGHKQRVRLSERCACRPDRLVRTDQGQRWRYERPDAIGHLRLACEDLVEQRALVERADDLTDHDGRLCV